MKKTGLTIIISLLCVLLCGCSVVFGAKTALEDTLKEFQSNLNAIAGATTDPITAAVAESFSYDVGSQNKNDETGAVTVSVEITTVDTEDLQSRASAACGTNQEKMSEWIKNAVKNKDYKLVTNKAEVPMVQNDEDKWEIDYTGDIFDFSNAFTGGLGSSIFSKEGTLEK
ncbi:MAG: hypothetical protein KBS52_00870 [Clostridiales bacterium]|nr:hypothetical protein [Candidatus Equinaster intestinalis]